MPSDCILHVGRTSTHGYGGVGRNGYAHRAAWEQAFGPVPEGLQVLHRCDVRKCINPEHLFLGTNQDNMDDKTRKGRAIKKIDFEMATEMLHLKRNNLSQNEIGRIFEVAQSNVSRAIRNLRKSYEVIGG